MNDFKFCPDCGGEMQADNAFPDERVLFTIPFTKIEIIFRNCNSNQWYCVECVNDKQNQNEIEMFNDAYEAGFDDGATSQRGLYEKSKQI